MTDSRIVGTTRRHPSLFDHSRLKGVPPRSWNHRRQRRRREWAKQILTTYGLSVEDYAYMLANQGGVCAMCGGEGGKIGLVVDHDHETDGVRALLCNKCNVLLGLAEDNPTVLQTAINYLKQHRCQSLQVVGEV